MKMTQEEEYKDILAAQAGDIDARNRIIEANLKMVEYLAKTFENHSLPFEDLVQEGVFGLIRAVEDFDCGSGNRFSTYAKNWVNQRMSRATANKGRAIRLPVHLVEAISKYKKMRKTLSYELGREPAPQEIGEKLGFSDSLISTIVKNMEQVSSLDIPIDSENQDSIGSLIEDTSISDVSSLLYNEDMRRAFSMVLATLEPKEARVISLHYGVNGESAHTLEQVGEILNRSREDVRLTEARGMRKLRHPTRAKILKEYLTNY